MVGNEEGLKVTRWSMTHNHPLEPSIMQVHPAFRRLTEWEMKELEPFLLEKCRTE